MAQYTKDELREIFRTPFNRESWKAILHNLFRADNIRLEAEQFTDPDEPEQGYYMGVHETADSYRIGLFYYKIDNGSVAHKKVGLRSLVKRFINPTWGNFDAAIVVFNDGKEWRLSFVCDIKDVATTPKRFTFVFGEHDNFYNTASQRFYDLQQVDATFENIRKAFSVDALSDDFFNDYRELYADFVQYITGKRYVKDGSKWEEKELSSPNFQFESSFDADEKEVRDYIKKMFGRITFLYFLQRKGWLNGDRQYMHNLFYNSDKKDNFLDGVLEILFFEVLNEDKRYRKDLVDELPGGRDIPYLNGGLFAKDDDDEKTCVFPEDYFKRLFDFLDSYNFTIDENDTEDAEIGIDPEMLGRIFESLLEDNKDKGAFYTPKEIVNYMCRESIIAYLQDTKFKADGNALIRQFVETFDRDLLSIEQRRYIKDRLKNIKICDPAIGSGAFPMGLVNLLSKIYDALRLSSEAAEIKRHIMEQNIYGVDIERGAVDIARLRFWLAMIVEEKEPMPLPNLHFKIMHGNSLLETYRGLDLSDLTKVDNQQELWDSTNSARETLVSDLKRYYRESDHTESKRILNSIVDNVRLQIYAKNENLRQNGLDPSDNSHFFLWHTWFADVFEKGGFDIVIGNPPYLKEGRASKSVFEGIKHTPYYKGKMDIWYMFACYGIDFLKDNGLLCFIATNNWVTSNGASLLRDKVIADTRIRQLCDFNNYMIFDTASIQTMVMLFEKNKIDDNYELDYRKLHGDKLSDVIDLLNHKVTDKTEYLSPVINRAFFTGKYLTFSNNDCILDKMCNTPGVTYLKSDELAQGIVFPQDFLNKKGQEKLGHHNVGDGIFGLSPTELNGLNLMEKELDLIKPYFTSEQIFRYYTSEHNTLWMIYTDSSYKNPHSMNLYPNLKCHLDQFVDILTSDNKPYGLHRARKQRFFIGEKVICQRKCAGRPVFSFSDFDCYVTQTYIVIKSAKWNHEVLTGILNSKIVEFWLLNRGKMQGENFQIDNEPLQQIPLVIPSDKVQDVIAEKVQCIIDLMAKDVSSDITKLEKDIDVITYHLYNITYDEILTIDPETSITKEEYDNYE